MSAIIQGRNLAAGSGQGVLLHTDLGLSFWGGVDPQTAQVIDQHHPLCGQVIAGRVLAVPNGRGSCTGSSTLLQLILGGVAPAALVLAEPDKILSLGALIAEHVFGIQLPVLCIGQQAFAALSEHVGQRVRVSGDYLLLDPALPVPTASAAAQQAVPLRLSAADQAMLAGQHGRAKQVAMQLVVKMAALYDAEQLLDVSQAHIDGCIYTGDASVRFAQQLVDWDAKVCVPTTLNSISVDQRQWRSLGIAAEFGEPASTLGDLYMAMGATLSFTCAPYLLDSAPAFGEQIVWAESNAVTYANSVLGARTLKYPDFLDICIAICGRAPDTGSHQAAGRRATVVIDVQLPAACDDSFWPLLGYHVGLLSNVDIPLLTGLEHSAPSLDDLKAFSAAFATTSAAPMFHIHGVTPEAADAQTVLGAKPPLRSYRINSVDLLHSWWELNSAKSSDVSLVAIGNPHCSLSELGQLAKLCEGRRCHADSALVITCGRSVYQQAEAAGYVAILKAFGACLINDTCWCMLGEPVVPAGSRNLMTNSGKYAHYAPGLAGRDVHFGHLAACIEAACSGHNQTQPPAWLVQPQPLGDR
jgi:predicted aconitase/predicted aconitase with swiveling domain